MNEKKSAVVYLRANDTKAIDAQRREVLEYAEQNGFQITGSYVDGSESECEEEQLVEKRVERC